MFYTLLEFAHLADRRNQLAVARVSAACLALPFASGFALAYLLNPGAQALSARIDTALFVATAFSITALPILGRILLEFQLTRSRLGVIAISAAAVNDVIGWLLLALITMLTVSGSVGMSFAVRASLLGVFGLASIQVVRPVLKRVVRRSAPNAGYMPANLLGGLLVVIFTAAMITYQIGIFAIFGGFMMGVVLFDEAGLVAAWRERVGGLVNVFFLPIFFTYTGLRTSIGGLSTSADWLTCLAIVVAASLSKWGAGYLAARRSGFGHADSSMMGFMMNTRALMELIVINVGFDLGILSPKMFTMLVVMAIASTVVTTPALRHYLRRPTAGSSTAGELRRGRS
ncbi:MAG: hypothetical protein NVSMB10_03290 [Steroidobacteraceae bacterium]